MWINNTTGAIVAILSQDQASRVWFCASDLDPRPTVDDTTDPENPPAGVTVTTSFGFFSTHHEQPREEMQAAEAKALEAPAKHKAVAKADT